MVRQNDVLVNECIVGMVFQIVIGGHNMFDSRVVWDWYGSPKFAINIQLKQNAFDGAWLKAHGILQIRLFETADDAPLPLAFAHVDIPLTWQEAFGQVRIRSYFPNHADLMVDALPSDGRREFVLDMYCLQDDFCGRRWTSVRGLESEVILQAVRAKWPEYVAGHHMVVNFVFPQPNWLDVTTVVLIAEFFLPGHDFDQSIAVLIDDPKAELFEGADSRRPIYVSPQVYGHEVLRKMGLDFHCQPLGYRMCLLKTSQGTIAQEEMWNSYRGAYVEIHQEDVFTVPVQERAVILDWVSFAEYLDAQQRRIRGPATIEVRTHAVDVDGAPLGMRRLYIDMADVLAPRRVWLWVYELWLDYVGVRDMQVYAVNPQPTQPLLSEVVVSHLLVGVDVVDGSHPVLCTLTVGFQPETTAHQIGIQAHLFPDVVDEQEIFLRTGLFRFAQEHTRQIYVRRGFTELLAPEQRYVVTTAEHYFVHMTLGRFSEFFQMVLGGYAEYTGALRFGSSEDLPPIAQGSTTRSDDVSEDSDTDEMAMMQRLANTPNNGRQHVQLVGLHGAFAVVTVDPTRTIMSQLGEIWPFSYRGATDVSELIAVTNPPSAPGIDEVTHLDMSILCYADDHFEQVHTDDILVLTTIAFQGPTGWTHHKRKVAWGPVRASRLQILHFFRVHWFCDRPSVICFLYVNGIHWPLMDYSVRSLTEGSHLFLQIRSDREDWCEVVHAEALERNRRVFQSSDEEPEDQQEEVEEEIPERQEEAEEEVDGPVDGSRSRSRSRDESDYSDD